MERNEVAIAFDIVLEEIENAIEGLNKEGAKAFQSGNYEVARDLMDKGSQMATFRNKVKDLQKEWVKIFATMSLPKSRNRRKKIAVRLKRGLRTPEECFRIPILQSLVELGGSASMADVLDRVESKMREQLNVYDLSPLPSNSTQLRWRNTAQWARNAMVKEGLMASNSRRGIWEITEFGKKWLLEKTKKDEK